MILPRINIRSMLVIVGLVSVLLAIVYGRFSHTFSVPYLIEVEVGDNVDVFESPGPDVDTDGGYEMPRVVSNAKVLWTNKGKKQSSVTLRMSIFEKMRMNHAIPEFWIDHHESDVDYLWLD